MVRHVSVQLDSALPQPGFQFAIVQLFRSPTAHLLGRHRLAITFLMVDQNSIPITLGTTDRPFPVVPSTANSALCRLGWPLGSPPPRAKQKLLNQIDFC